MPTNTDSRWVNNKIAGKASIKALASITATATSGNLPTADGSVTIADATTPTVTELLAYCVELHAKIDALVDSIQTP